MVHAYFLADKKSNGESVSVPDVASHAGMNLSVVSRNNKFFTSFGVIEGGQRKRLTDPGRELGLAVSHQDKRLIRSTLAKLVDDSEFLSRIVDAVRIRSGMDASSLQSHIAISAGVPKNPQFMTGAAALMNLLLESGHLNDEGGTLRAGDGHLPERADRGPVEREGEIRATEPVTASLDSRLWRSITAPTVSGITLGAYRPEPSVTINVHLDVTPDNVDEVIDLLRRLTGFPPLPPAAEKDSESTSE